MSTMHDAEIPTLADEATVRTLIEISLDGTCDGFGDTDGYGRYVSLIEDYEDADFILIQFENGSAVAMRYSEHIAVIDGALMQPARVGFNRLMAEYDAWLDMNSDEY